MKATICMLIALCCVAMNGYPQNAQEPVRATSLFELNTAMVAFGAPSTQLILGWQADVNTLFQDGMDGVEGYFDLRHPGQELLRSGALALFTGVSLIVNRAFSLTAHDQNHMEAALAIGASSVGLVRADTFQSLSLGEFFLESFDFTSEPGLYSYVKPNATLREQAYVAGEGLDTNQVTANAVSTGMIEVGGHVMDLAPYLLNKLWGIPYFLETGPYSDAANYVSLLQQQGYGIPGTNSVIFLSAASCLLSGGFLGLMQGTLNFIENGDTAVKPLKLKVGDVSLFWPEVTTWLNPENVSLQVSDECRVAGFPLPAGGDRYGGAGEHQRDPGDHSRDKSQD